MVLPGILLGSPGKCSCMHFEHFGRNLLGFSISCLFNVTLTHRRTDYKGVQQGAWTKQMVLDGFTTSTRIMSVFVPAVEDRGARATSHSMHPHAY